MKPPQQREKRAAFSKGHFTSGKKTVLHDPQVPGFKRENEDKKPRQATKTRIETLAQVPVEIFQQDAPRSLRSSASPE